MVAYFKTEADAQRYAAFIREHNQRRPVVGRRGDLWFVRWTGGKRKNRSGETKAFRRLQKEGATPRVMHKLMRSARRRVRRAWYTDPPVKGRKVNGGRSVTLRNMASVTIIRRRNGTVGIRGVKK